MCQREFSNMYISWANRQLNKTSKNLQNSSETEINLNKSNAQLDVFY